jgi:hypothetical protein
VPLRDELVFAQQYLALRADARAGEKRIALSARQSPLPAAIAVKSAGRLHIIKIADIDWIVAADYHSRERTRQPRRIFCAGARPNSNATSTLRHSAGSIARQLCCSTA